MKYIVSRFNHDAEWLKECVKSKDDLVLYDRSEMPMPDSIHTKNIGTDIYDKFSYIIDNYDNLPDVAVYTKCNLFKYMSKEEFDKVKDNTTFTPLLTKNHKVYNDDKGEPICFYDAQGMYNERNDYWYLYPHPAKFAPLILDFFKMRERMYNAFAPGSNYILPKENILKHSKETYIKLRSYLDWDVYPGDAQLLERNLYYFWR